MLVSFPDPAFMRAGSENETSIHATKAMCFLLMQQNSMQVNVVIKLV